MKGNSARKNRSTILFFTFYSPQNVPRPFQLTAEKPLTYDPKNEGDVNNVISYAMIIPSIKQVQRTERCIVENYIRGVPISIALILSNYHLKMKVSRLNSGPRHFQSFSSLLPRHSPDIIDSPVKPQIRPNSKRIFQYVIILKYYLTNEKNILYLYLIIKELNAYYFSL